MTPFIITTPSSQSVERKRQIIRSHAMRGKNRKKPPPRPQSWIRGSNPDGPSPAELWRPITHGNGFSLPAKIGGEFSFTPLLAEIGPEFLETAWNFKHGMTPVEFSPTFRRPETSWFDPMWNDAACLHLTVYVTKIYLNLLHGREQNSGGALAHFGTTLTILQQRISNGENELSLCDSTILVVVGLTMLATACGDLGTAQNHRAGLQKMVMLRGGISVFQDNGELQAKICRADLGVSLSTGRKTAFFSDGISWELCLAPQPRRPILESQKTYSDHEMRVLSLSGFLGRLDTRLRIIWDDLSEVVRGANLVMQCKRSIDMEIYRDVLISVHYRLVNLSFDEKSVDEVTRLGVLAFASTLFLQWRNVRTHHAYLSQHLRSALSQIRHVEEAIPIQFMLWLGMVAAVSLFDKPEPAQFLPPVSELLRAASLESWKEVKESLKSVLWVDEIHDALAKQVVEAAL